MNGIGILVLGVTMALVSGWVAQAEEPDLELRQNCRTALPQEKKQDSGVAKPNGDAKLSDSLASCQGVLEPPSVRDDMAVPPPENDSETPVLPPESVPQQTPKG